MAGAALAEQFITASPAVSQIWTLFIVFLLVGYGAYTLFGRRITNRLLGTSTGEVASFTAAFGVGFFNYSHALFWLCVSTIMRHWGLLSSDWASRITWGFFAWAGVLVGYFFTARLFRAKQISVATSASASFAKLLGVVLLLLGSSLAFSLLG
jgi:hypothetical protein